MISTLLIANRGEIAVRIIATARALGIRTVAVHSDADADALHVRLADEARRIGPTPARDSYLDMDAVVRAAVESGADAVHPGYGFLSENADFARAVAAAGLTFVGPDPTVIERMSDKVAARAAAVAAGLPVVPGSDGVIEGTEAAHAAAARIGYPIAVKACFGGGGRGMRIAADAAALDQALESAAREAGAAFGRPEVFLERYVPRPRHVEVQIIADTHGNVLHIGDRDCTVQRRHQKLIEEAPAPSLPPAMRAGMRDAAVELCRAEGYTGAGTVEFLVDPATDSFFFLEMNTRLQVEHGVSELVSGIDLVEAQLIVAAGDPLPFAQDDIVIRGHAIEARIAAEDAWDDFRPSPGRVGRLDVPVLPWLRADLGIASGDAVQPFYDSMIGKLLVLAPTREQAAVRLAQALRALRVEGVPTTAPYLADVLDRPAFRSVTHFTGSVEQDWPPDPAARVSAIPATEEARITMSPITERQAALARPVTIFGAVPPSSPSAIPSSRRSRAGAETATDGPTAATGQVRAPMDGTVVAVAATVGSPIAAGDTVLVMEAMKMEVRILAPTAGALATIAIAVGDPVRKGGLLATIEPASA